MSLAVSQSLAGMLSCCVVHMGPVQRTRLILGAVLVQKRAVRKGVSMFGWDSCRIARLLFDRPCSAIREQLQV